MYWEICTDYHCKFAVVRGALTMNIQIFGTKKSSDTRKAERFFKERGIKFQSIDLKEKGLSKGEFNSVMQAVGGVDAMIDPDCKDKDLLALVTYISADERADTLTSEHRNSRNLPSDKYSGLILKALIKENGLDETEAQKYLKDAIHH